MFLEILDIVAERGLAFVISCSVIYFAIRYFRMKEKEHNFKFENKTQMLQSKTVQHFVTSMVWYYSKNHLQMIKSVLITNDVKNREEEIKLKIKNSVERISLTYIEIFNELKTPIEKLGDWYNDIFEYDKFYEEIWKIVFKAIQIPPLKTLQEKEHFILLSITEKMDDIANIMTKYQYMANRKLDKELKVKEKFIEKKSKPFFFV